MSKTIPKFYATVENHKLLFYNRERWSTWLQSLVGKEVVVTVSEIQDDRGLNQLRYLWGVLYKEIAEDTGNSVEDIHDFFKGKFLAFPASLGHDVVTTVGSTTTLTYQEMEAFTTSVRQWAAMELGITIPARGEVTLL